MIKTVKAKFAGRIPHGKLACDEIQFGATAFCNYCKIDNLGHGPRHAADDEDYPQCL
jgi:hypothetical protein